jgi:hypothetical protein
VKLRIDWSNYKREKGLPVLGAKVSISEKWAYYLNVLTPYKVDSERYTFLIQDTVLAIRPTTTGKVAVWLLLQASFIPTLHTLLSSLPMAEQSSCQIHSTAPANIKKKRNATAFRFFE